MNVVVIHSMDMRIVLLKVSVSKVSYLKKNSVATWLTDSQIILMRLKDAF